MPVKQRTFSILCTGRRGGREPWKARVTVALLTPSMGPRIVGCRIALVKPFSGLLARFGSTLQQGSGARGERASGPRSTRPEKPGTIIEQHAKRFLRPVRLLAALAMSVRRLPGRSALGHGQFERQRHRGFPAARGGAQVSLCNPLKLDARYALLPALFRVLRAQHSLNLETQAPLSRLLCSKTTS